MTRRYITSSWPFFVPAIGSFLKILEGGIIFVAVALKLLLCFLKLVLVLPLVLAYFGHVLLCNTAFEAEAILFISIASLEIHHIKSKWIKKHDDEGFGYSRLHKTAMTIEGHTLLTTDVC